MSQIHFDPHVCRNELRPYLQRKRVVTRAFIDRSKSSITTETLRVNVQIEGMNTPVLLVDLIRAIDLPPQAPLIGFPSKTYSLQKYLRDPTYRNNFGFDAIDHVLATYPFIAEAQSDEDIAGLDLKKIHSQTALGEVVFMFWVAINQKLHSGQYRSLTEALTLDQVLTSQELEAVWEKSTRPLTWHDLPSLL